jgi:phosphoribosylformylglycinamidine (FGAM) synthase-like enzyme
MQVLIIKIVIFIVNILKDVKKRNQTKFKNSKEIILKFKKKKKITREIGREVLRKQLLIKDWV